MAFALVNPRKMLLPEKCVVCESKPNGRVVDTGHTLMSVPSAHILRGRKYICETCGEKIAKALACLTSKQAASMRELVATQGARIEELEGSLNLQERMDALAAELAPLLPLPTKADREDEDPATD